LISTMLTAFDAYQKHTTAWPSTDKFFNLWEKFFNQLTKMVSELAKYPPYFDESKVSQDIK